MDWNKRSYTKNQFKSAWNNSTSISEVASKLNLQRTGNSKSLKVAAQDLGLKDNHFKSRSYDGVSRVAIPLSDILVENSSYSSSSYLRIRLIRAGLLEEKCSAPYCPVPEEQIDPWTGIPVETPKLTLDHINGVNTDNRLENLRILCNYCHAHTDTFCGGGRTIFYYCSDCGSSISSGKSKRCMKCDHLYREKSSKFANLSVREIVSSVEKFGYLRYSKMIGVSDNGIRKYLRKEGINPLPKKKKV